MNVQQRNIYTDIAALRKRIDALRAVELPDFSDFESRISTLEGGVGEPTDPSLIEEATPVASGLMSAADKEKLDRFLPAAAEILTLTGSLTVPQDGTAALVETSSILLDEDVTSTTIANTTAEQSLYSYTVPGGSLGTTHKLHIVLNGSFFNAFDGDVTEAVDGYDEGTFDSGTFDNYDIIGTGPSDATATIKVKYGATTIFNDTSAVLATSANAHPWRVEVDLVAASSATAQIASGSSCTGSAAGIAGQTNGTTVRRDAVHATVTEDSSINKTLEITVTLSVLSASISFTAYNVFVELLRK